MAQHTHRTEHMASTMAASGEPGGRSCGGVERQRQRQVGAAEVRAAEAGSGSGSGRSEPRRLEPQRRGAAAHAQSSSSSPSPCGLTSCSCVGRPNGGSARDGAISIPAKLGADLADGEAFPIVGASARLWTAHSDARTSKHGASRWPRWLLWQPHAAARMSRRGGAAERTPLLYFPLSAKQLGGTSECNTLI